MPERYYACMDATLANGLGSVGEDNYNQMHKTAITDSAGNVNA